MKKRDLSEANKNSGIEVKRLEGPPSAGASHTNATPASATGGGQINVSPLDNPTSAGSGNVQATINSTNNTNSENARANTDANSTGGAGT